MNDDYKWSKYSKYLFTAIENNNLEKVQHWIAKGVDVNAPDADGLHPLICAVRGISTSTREIVIALIRAGAGVNARYKGYTALMIPLLQFGYYTPSMTELIDAGADINTQDYFGDTALMHACERGCYTTVRNLLYEKANLYIKNNAGNTAFDIAKERKDEACSRGYPSDEAYKRLLIHDLLRDALSNKNIY